MHHAAAAVRFTTQQPVTAIIAAAGAVIVPRATGGAYLLIAHPPKVQGGGVCVLFLAGPLRLVYPPPLWFDAQRLVRDGTRCVHLGHLLGASSLVYVGAKKLLDDGVQDVIAAKLGDLTTAYWAFRTVPHRLRPASGT